MIWIKKRTPESQYLIMWHYIRIPSLTGFFSTGGRRKEWITLWRCRRNLRFHSILTYPTLLSYISLEIILPIWDSSCSATRMTRPNTSKPFAVQFLERMVAEDSWPGKILETCEANFHFNRHMNSLNCCI